MSTLARFLGGRVAAMAVIVDRAVARGELPPGTDAAGVIGTVTAVICYRLYILGEDATQAVAAARGRALLAAGEF